MPLTFIGAVGQDWNTRSYRFNVSDGTTEFLCAVSYEAMDDAERATRVDDRDAQFQRLKPRIVEAAARKYFAGRVEAGSPRVVVKTADLGAVPPGVV